MDAQLAEWRLELDKAMLGYAKVVLEPRVFKEILDRLEDAEEALEDAQAGGANDDEYIKDLEAEVARLESLLENR